MVIVASVRAEGEEERGGLERARDTRRNREQENEDRWLSEVAKPAHIQTVGTKYKFYP